MDDEPEVDDEANPPEQDEVEPESPRDELRGSDDSPSALVQWVAFRNPATIDPEVLRGFNEILRKNFQMSSAWSDAWVGTQESLRRMFRSSAQETIRTLNASLARDLWNRSTFRQFRPAESDPSPYSPELRSAADYFDRDDSEIGSVDELNRAIALLIRKVPDLDLV